ncbi:MAG TPA: ATP-binding cassette domain-containing protein [Cellulomonas sp.]
MITLSSVTKTFGSLVVLRDVSLSLPDGSVTALLGANGSGKTTLGRLLLGLEAPTSGVVSGLSGLRRSAVFQDNRLCEQLTAVGNVRLVLPRSVSRSEVADELRAVGLADESLRKPVRSLSGGQRRRVALVRGVLAPSDLVVLDEPFTGLDTDAKAATLAWVRSRLPGRTALLITHDPAEASYFAATVLRLPGPAEQS